MRLCTFFVGLLSGTVMICGFWIGVQSLSADGCVTSAEAVAKGRENIARSAVQPSNAALKENLKAASNFAEKVAGGKDNAQYFNLLEQTVNSIQRMKRPARAHGQSINISPFARMRAETRAKTAEAASIKNDKTWIKNQAHLVRSALAAQPGRIFGGQKAKADQFTHCAAVGTSTGFCCSGTLVSPNVVVTAGHCHAGGCAKRVYFGVDSNNPGTGLVVNAAKAILHKDYNQFTLKNDIAILILEKNVNNISPCPIASSNDIDKATFLRLAGFGLTETQVFGEKYWVDVAVASNDCKCSISQSKYGCHAGIEIVAGGNGFDSCNGDSGGPAYFVKNGKLLLAGATSRATANRVKDCGDGGIYVRIDQYKKWIIETAKKNGGIPPQ